MGDCVGLPRVQYKRIYEVLKQDITEEEAVRRFLEAWDAGKRTVGWSYDDAGIGALEDKTAILHDIALADQQTFTDWFARYYPGTKVRFYSPIPEPQFPMVAFPMTGNYYITSVFNDPRSYGLHEGIDFAPKPVGTTAYALAAYDGVVTSVATTSGYGNRVVIRHTSPTGLVFYTWYAHLANFMVQQNQSVTKGTLLGIIGSTGNSTGVHLHFNYQVPGHGLGGYVIPDVVDPKPLIIFGSPVPPPTGSVQFGLHATADSVVAPTEPQAFSTARIELVKVLSNIAPQSVTALRQAVPNAKWIIRAFLDFGGRRITPQQFVTDTVSDVQRTISTTGLPASQIVIELHNEPNLVAEGLTSSWANGVEFSTWLLTVLALYRSQLPGVTFAFPGLSPGASIVGVRQDHKQFADQAAAAIAACEFLGVHSYWSNIYPMSTTLSETVDWFSKFSKPMYVTEASNNDGVTAPNQKGLEYITFYNALKSRPLVRGVTYFVASATNPLFAKEVWVGTDIPNVVATR